MSRVRRSPAVIRAHDVGRRAIHFTRTASQGQRLRTTGRPRLATPGRTPFQA